MNRLEDKVLYAVVNKKTGEAWGDDTYSSSTGCKTSWFHAHKYRTWDGDSCCYRTTRFDDQDEYEIIKVKLVRC